MPRLVNALPKYQRHKASGQAVVNLSGHDFYLGSYGSAASKAEYERVVGEWLAKGRQLPRQPGSSLTVVELTRAFKLHAKTYYRKDGKPTSSLIRVKVALRLLRQTYGDTFVVSFGPLSLQAIRHQLIASGKSRRYINHLIEQIKRVFKWGVSQELVPAMVGEALKSLEGLRKGRSEAHEPAPIRPVAETVVEATLASVSPVVADMVRLQRFTGCRPGEVVILRPCDVDTSGKVWVYTPSSHKTEHHGKQRVILIGPRAQNVLRPYLLRDKAAFCFSPADSETRRRAELAEKRLTPLSCGNRSGTNRCRTPKRKAGERYTSGSYARAIVRGCELAFGMPEELRVLPKKLSTDERKSRRQKANEWRAEFCWSPGQLRHSAGTDIRKQFGAEAASTILGHSNLSTTEIYAEKNIARAAEIMLQCG